MSLTPTAEFERRRARVRVELERDGFDGVIAYSTAKIQANVRWLSDYFVRFAGWQHVGASEYVMLGSWACLVPLEGEPLLCSDLPWDSGRLSLVSIYPDSECTPDLGAELGRQIHARGLKRVAIDNWLLFPAEYYVGLTREAPNTEFVPSRMLSEDTMRRLGDVETAGASQAGAGVSTASGLPEPTRGKKVERGEWYFFDPLPRHDGYCGDIARVRLAGDERDADPQLQLMYDVTYAMNRAAIAAIKPGVPGKQLNDVADEIARDAGLLDHTFRLLGHAVGIDIHDIPDYRGGRVAAAGGRGDHDRAVHRDPRSRIGTDRGHGARHRRRVRGAEHCAPGACRLRPRSRGGSNQAKEKGRL